jgi:hypothetical protein
MAAARLAKLCAMNDVPSSYLDRDTQWHKFQESIRSFWQNCCMPGPSCSGDLRWAAPLLGINCSSSDIWYARAGKLAGVVTKAEINEHLPGFRGLSRVWKEAVVVALHSLPGKISSFLTILRSGSEDPFVLYRVPDCSGLQLGGFLGLEAVTGPDHPDFGNQVLLASDPLIALRLHAHQLALKKHLLPVAGFCQEDTSYLNVGNGLFAGKKVCVWAPAITKELLLLAKKVDGWIVTDENRDHAYWDDMDRVGMPVWVACRLRLARPWPQFLAAYLESKDSCECCDLLSYLKLSEQERDRVLECCTPDKRARLSAAQRERIPKSTSVSARKSVVEQNGCWYLREADPSRGLSSSSLLSDCILRIDQIVRFERSRKKLYEGRLLYKGREVAFSVAAGETHRFLTRTATWMCNKLIDEGLGILHCERRSFQRLVDVALSLHEPIMVTGRDRCGWVEDENAFVFDGFSISPKGKVETGIAVYSSFVPTRNLHPPQDLTGEQIALLSDAGPVGSLVWPVTACVIANVLSPFLNQPTTGIALLGEGAGLLGPWIARKLGCGQ